MLTEKEKLDELLALGIELNQLNDLDILLEKILTDARRFVNADAGSIYKRLKPQLVEKLKEFSKKAVKTKQGDQNG